MADPVDDIGGLGNGDDVSKPDTRAYLKARTVCVFSDADEVRSYDLSARTRILVSDRIYRKDTSSTAADDGVSCIIDQKGTHWIRIVYAAEDGAGFNPRGTYSAGTTYELLDVVVNQSSSWVYRNTTPSAGNAPPTLPTEINAYWQLQAKVGPQGPTVPPQIVADPDPFPAVPFKFSVWARWSTLRYIDADMVFTGPSANRSYYDAAGIIKYVGAGVPRFDTIYATGETGLLIERGKTNLVLRSQEFNTSWNLDNITITADATVAPDGMTTADKIVETATNLDHRIFQTVAKASSALAYCFSIYVKAAERDRGRVILFDGTATVSWDYNLTAGTIGSPTVGAGWSAASQGIEPLPNGWFRIFVNATTPATASITPLVYLLSSGGATPYMGTGTWGTFFWGAQLEQHTRPTSYIATAATQVGRSSEFVKKDITTSVNPLEATIYMKTAWRYSSAANNIVGGYGNNAAAFGTDIYLMRTSTNYQIAAPLGGSVSLNSTANSARLAFAFKASDFAMYLNGASGFSAAGVMPSNTNQLTIGASGWGPSDNTIDGIIMEYGFAPRRWPNTYLAIIAPV